MKKKNSTLVDWKKNKLLYLMVLPVVIYYILFHYVPMFGLVIAFKDYKQVLGHSFFQNVISSKWVGFEHFRTFLSSRNFFSIMWNTLRISMLTILFGFPAPILLALLLNEVRQPGIKKSFQTLTYIPHFISLVVICGIIRNFTSDTGIISYLVSFFTHTKSTNLLLAAKNFDKIYVTSDIWQTVGWGSIIYLSALSGISADLYEAAKIDGANRWKQTLHVTLPSLLPTITIMLILRLGRMLNVGYEKIILLYNDLTRPKAEVISTYVYQMGLLNRDYSFSTAIGLFNSVLNVIFLVTANTLSKKMSETSLW